MRVSVVRQVRRLPRIGSLALLLFAAAAAPRLEAQAGGAAKPARPRASALSARSALATLFTANRVQCGLQAPGGLCGQGNESPTDAETFWPKGTHNEYVFAAGLQVAAVVGADGGGWAGDTTGAFFFDLKGTTEHGRTLEPLHLSTDPADAASWPEAARVPQGDSSEAVYGAALRGRPFAAQGDAWQLYWDGDPALGAGRPHPLGVVVEQRTLGWSYPAGNEDVVYHVVTVYNATATDPAAYAGVRPAMRDRLLRQAQELHRLNPTGPAGGYTMTDLHVGAMMDDDVASAGVNYSTVSLPAAMGFSYERGLDLPFGWSFDPATMSPPFLAGAGFVGTKLLAGPSGADGLQLFSNFANGLFGEPQNVGQLYRYLSGNLQPGLDNSCSSGLGPATHVCAVVQTARDTRYFESTQGTTLAPGRFATVVFAQIFAAPVKVASYVPGTDLPPGDPLELGDPAKMADGVNLIDSIAGYTGFTDRNGDGVVQEGELRTVPRSLYGKAQVAQLLYENGFLLPQAPDAPDFFLIPGDQRVTVVWRPSTSEQTGDPYFALAQAVTLPDGRPNPLYDPSFRQFDVEGYRIWRGRTDAPAELQLVAQFDYAGTAITDYGDFIQPSGRCAPEIGVAPAGCPVPYGDGVPAGAGTAVPLTGQIVQVRFGDRFAVNGGIYVVKADTLGVPPLRPLEDTGVPFTWVDETVRNDVRYWYAVTAFDVNSIQSGPASAESPRVAKPAIPTRRASNYETSATFAASIYGRTARVDSGRFALPTIDPATGIFSGPMPAADGARLDVPASVPAEVLAAGSAEARVRLDSLQLGSSFDGLPVRYYFTATGAGATTRFVVPVVQQAGSGTATGTGAAPAVAVDPALAARYGASAAGFSVQAALTQALPGDYYTTQYGRGCVNGAAGFDPNDQGLGCEYNGSRWFDGPSPQKNETVANPNGNNPYNFILGNAPANYNNAGGLAGVAVVHEPIAYLTVSSAWREVQGALGGAARAADFNLYWGAAGRIDSVVDVTHDVVVPFDTAMGASWGILTQPASNVAGSFDARPELTPTDLGCVQPLHAIPGVQGRIPCTAPAPVKLATTVVLGPVAEMLETPASAKTSPASANPGFLLYMPGHVYMVETAALPAAGAVWSLRTYVGAISGGNGANGSYGPYEFTPATRPFTAAGAELRLRSQVVNQLAAPVSDDLRRVHTVPDPYYVDPSLASDARRIRFVNLPAQAIVRIYSSSGILVKVIEHGDVAPTGTAEWDVMSRTGKPVASGVYFYHVEAGGARRVGRFTIVNVRGGE